MKKMRIYRSKWRRPTCAVAALLLFPALYASIPLPAPLFAPDYSTLVTDRNGELLRAFLNRNQQWCFPPQPDLAIPDKLQKAILHFEDRRFYDHVGVDPFSLLRGLYQNAVSGKIVSGASTITMQVARLMQPKERTYFNKGLEILQALKIERRYTKEQILRFYLDHAPYGGNIIGYQAACLKYFRKRPEQLTWGEAATLAVLPNAPGLVSPTADRKSLEEKRNRLLHRLRDAGFIDAQTCSLSTLEPTPSGARPFPMYAPHLARYLKDRQDPGRHQIATTLDGNLQRHLQELVERHLHYLRHRGIRNGAALLVETASGKVRAYVGSQGFFDAAAQGQVDGVRARRSSGSLLKPFLYALSMDAGLILPQTRIEDIPTHYGAFAPNNADEKFSGLATVHESLVRSLNVPAVRLLHTYGVYPFYQFLKEAGLTTLFRPADDYGLPLIIGGAEVSLWDMAALFRGLATGGRFYPLQYLEDSSATEGGNAPPPLISPGASYLTLEMLRDLQRPGAEYYWRQYQDHWPLAWKTGTSYGQRDAWAVGVNPEWVIAVWLGNFSGEGNPDLMGARTAGPLLFDIFNTVPKDQKKNWFARPDDQLASLLTCLDTGFPSGPHCPHQAAVSMPRHMKPLKICPYHKTTYLSGDGTQQVCSLCWEPGNFKPVRQLLYPAAVAQYLRGRGQQVHTALAHKADCPVQPESHPLQITYPDENAHLQIGRDFYGDWQQVVLRAAHTDRYRNLYWYLDEHFLGTTRDKHVQAAELSQGWHLLEVVDGRGHRDRTRFHVSARK